ncbi:M48 family metalloprotease [Novosphingobium flavum]|uniref:M48 family metalloprotease n=1 Tax=Novosphingobium aerophilum TaxID=2839843 RepID=A0A7X1F8C8_9SPHN|nr:M48 family metallopeptidase [Novosphingobium aerophilum]MBC2652230.1 M48 family metalloprotease [Novosphingobium aerophilum]MBC2662657.1 M48 family metalloprotease [Novosphingobium aerophilum]
MIGSLFGRGMGLLAWLGGIGLAAGPADGAAAGPFVRPPYAGAYEPQGVDERGLWMDLDEFERDLGQSPGVVRDPGLNAFVRQVLCDTVGADRCGALRCYIVADSRFNAFMAPNGMTVIYTGLLARLHSQAELAGVLGHEFAHFERRHSLAGALRQRSAGNWSAWISLLGVLTAVRTGAVRQELQIGLIAFTRGQEGEADALAARLVEGSRFRLAMAAVWRRAIEEDDALRREKGLRRVRHDITSLADDHPADGQRMAMFAAEELRVGSRGLDGGAEYAAATEPELPLLFAALVRGRDFAVADYVLRSRGEALGWSGALLTLRGDLFRLRGHPRDLVTAEELFGQAIAAGRAPPEAWRGLGLVQLRRGNAAGKAALASYLTLAPSAADAPLIRNLLDSGP